MQTIIRAAFPEPVDTYSLQEGALQQGEAAVLIALAEPSCDIILTRRATHLHSHAGEVALPGGRRDPQDASLAVTALREAQEEIGLDPTAVDLLGVLPSRRSRFGVHVLPFVGFVKEGAVLTPNPEELSAVFHVPLQFFRKTSPVLAHEVNYQGLRYLMPCYYWQDEIVWGLTARFIISFVNTVFDAGIQWPDPKALD